MIQWLTASFQRVSGLHRNRGDLNAFRNPSLDPMLEAGPETLDRDQRPGITVVLQHQASLQFKILTGKHQGGYDLGTWLFLLPSLQKKCPH